MKNTIYNNCGRCLSDPALFRSVNWPEEEEARNISAQLQQCKPIDVEYALEFFTKCSPVRRALHPQR
jgi:hypothetical protein